MPRWIKAFVAATLMVALVFMMDWSELFAQAIKIDAALAAVAFVAIVLQMPVNGTKWYWSLRLHDRPFPWPYLYRVSCMGYFYNNFLPSAIGGDVYRAYRTWSSGGEKAAAVSAVLVERLVGVALLMMNGFIGALFLFDHAVARSFVAVCLFAAVAGLICLPILIRMERRGVVSRRFPKLAAVESMLGRILKLRVEWLWLIVSSISFQGLAAWVVYLCFAAVGAPIDVPTALLVTAAAGLASVLPISISGLGVVEGSIAGTAVALGGSFEAAVLAALLLRFLAFGVSGVCGVFCLFDDGVRVDPEAGRQAMSGTCTGKSNSMESVPHA